ncbi:Facilitated trehalose transporter Tret1 [Melipona quadrifasciata]|uniref:Facilitated trehalose transporter Tret1 n=1 Tax=Melipona quadrifasciata TaxID=166423 RepID=A0A0M8ZVU7_9HYME|nr:Facilitated trehalose transporter Tret1 [Melipona quadrifasciata]
MFSKSKSSFYYFLANISSFAFGTMIGWQSPTIPQLQSETPPVGNEPMTNEAASWLTGIMCLTAALTSLIIGIIVNRFGHKVTGYLIALAHCTSWLFTILATQHMHLFIGFFFSGISGGMTLFSVPLYVSEIASDGIRGMLGSLMVFVLNGGILFAYVLGALLPYQWYSITMFAFPLLYIATFLFVPESPVYLIRSNRINDASRQVQAIFFFSSLTWLRGGKKSVVEQEMLRLQQEAKEITVSGSWTNKLSELFRDRATIKGLCITLGMFCGQQLAGIFIMISYTETIFKMSGSSLSPNGSAIIVGTIQVFGSWLSTTLMERAGRRPLLLISCFGMGTCHCVLGVFCYLQTLGYDVSKFSWISIIALSVFMIAYGLGMGPGPYVISSEILSRDVSSMVVTLGMFTAWAMAFIVVKLFPTVVNLLGIHGCFFLLGIFCGISFAFIFMLIPETKGLPRQVILDRLNGVSSSSNETQYVSSQKLNEKDVPLPELI